MYMKLLRSLSAPVKEVLQRKMVFLGGARQVGKTVFALNFLNPSRPTNPNYFNWDRASDKKLILKDEIPSQGLIVLDEIHKYKKWRALVKGFYDKYHEQLKIMVTGSARLDYFRKGGDSLLGRYRYFRLHPFTLPEIKGNKSDLMSLLKFGGFPEPFVLQSEKEHRIWQNERAYRIVNDDIRDLSTIKELSLMSLLVELLPPRVGAPLSLKSLSEDLSVSQPSVERWLQVLDAVYYSFRIAPFGSPKIRAVKKLQKIYLWDWSLVEDPGIRFENLVASHLLKLCHFLEDTQGYKMEMRYLRDTDKKEIDFVVLKNKKPIFSVECKTGEKNLSPHITYFQQRTDIPAFYQVHLGQRDYGNEKTGRVLPFTTFCAELNLV